MGSVNGFFDISKTGIETLMNCPDHVANDCYLTGCNITSLEYLPKFIGDELYVNEMPLLKNPFEYRYILYSKIINDISIDDIEISDIILKYYGKPEYLHLAMEELMNLGEARGFTYD